jgi:hypothetical protein
VRSEIKRAQAEMRVVIGVALGIQAMIEGEVDLHKSFFQNAIEIVARADDELLKSMAKELQNHINENEPT